MGPLLGCIAAFEDSLSGAVLPPIVYPSVLNHRHGSHGEDFDNAAAIVSRHICVAVI
jgi:hypothetical protein